MKANSVEGHKGTEEHERPASSPSPPMLAAIVYDETATGAPDMMRNTEAFDIGKAEEPGEERDRQRERHQLDGDGGPEVAAVRPDGTEVQGAAEHEEGHRGREAGEFADRLFEGARQMDAEQQERKADERAEDERVRHDVLQEFQRLDVPPRRVRTG